MGKGRIITEVAGEVAEKVARLERAGGNEKACNCLASILASPVGLYQRLDAPREGIWISVGNAWLRAGLGKNNLFLTFTLRRPRRPALIINF